MEDLLHMIYQEQVNRLNTLGILSVEKGRPESPITDSFNMIVLVIIDESNCSWDIKHYEVNGETAAVHTVGKDQLEEWMETSLFRRAIEWIISGEIVYEQNKYISSLKEQLNHFPRSKRVKRIAVEFAKLTKTYNESRHLYQNGQYLDAYSRVLRSLHYLARLTIIEKGFHPEMIVWNQVKQLDLEVYKLYEELIMSSEEIDKRVELMLLAVEFAISTRAKMCSAHLLHIMRGREGFWTLGELMAHPEIKAYAPDLSSMVDYLTDKRLLQTIQVRTETPGIYHRKYQINYE